MLGKHSIIQKDDRLPFQHTCFYTRAGVTDLVVAPRGPSLCRVSAHWSYATASDQAMYDRLKKESQNKNLSPLNSESHDVYYMFNTTECQLWVDGAMFYGLTCPQNVYGFLQFEETCYFDFIPTIVSTYCKTFVECTPLVVSWLTEAQLECSFLYQIFGRK